MTLVTGTVIVSPNGSGTSGDKEHHPQLCEVVLQSGNINASSNFDFDVCSLFTERCDEVFYHFFLLFEHLQLRPNLCDCT